MRSNLDGGVKMNYKEEIIRMIEEIEDIKIIKLIYGFVKRGYKEEKAGK